ncbi:MAG: hypothetical protein LUC87_00510 [Clostridiales bacterium]|nr:hypothetical protein [Clostridiales bacterium]
MANRNTIAADLRRQYGNTLSAKQVGEYIGAKSYHTTKKFLSSIDSYTVEDGGWPRYLAIDVAAAIDRRQMRAAGSDYTALDPIKQHRTR